MTTAEKTIPTPDEVFEKLTEVRKTLEGLKLHQEYIIEDYPSGRHRVKCKLEVEYKKGHGRRTVRTTTSKHGAWCKPKKSTYSNEITIVVTGEAVEREAAWLSISPRSIGLQSASGSWTVLAEAPHHCAPRRKDKPYTINDEPKVLPADPPELCDAWDAWWSGLLEISAWMKARYEQEVEGKTGYDG